MIVGGMRELACTEWGYQGIPDAQIAECVRQEWSFWRDNLSPDAPCIRYQLNDPPTPTTQPKFGIRDYADVWKLHAKVSYA